MKAKETSGFNIYMDNILNNTPNANRIHIAIFGRRNVGKSSIINRLVSQDISIVSAILGTTTDPVYKSIEINGLGACVIVDTAGFDDIDTELGELRVNKTKKIIAKTDIAILVLDASDIENNNFDFERKWIKYLEDANTYIIIAINKIDLIDKNDNTKLSQIENILDKKTICISAKNDENIKELIDAIILSLKTDDELSIVGHLINENDVVMLVMPQDIQAPKGRLILPQVQTIRDLLDNKAIIVSSTFDKIEQSLNALKKPPKLIITDSQIFKEVENIKPEASLLTSFSVLFARYKGDEKVYKNGACFIDNLKENDSILIAESCTHLPLDGDIARIKLPKMLKNKIGKNINIDIVSGNNFPDNLTPYKLIIHCGGCMATRKAILSRIKSAQKQNVAITNYGMAIAKLTNTFYV